MLLLNDLPVLEATWSIPRIGTWTLDAAVHSEADLAGVATVVSPDPDARVTWRGTIVSSQRFYDTVKVRIVGGAGGLTKKAKAKHYQNTSAGVVLQDLLRSAGEKLDSTSSARSARLEAWTVNAGTPERPTTVGAALRALVEEKAQLAWRALPGGSIWVGTEAWPDTALGVNDYDVLERDGDTGKVHYRLARAELLPGTVIEGDRLGHVEIHLDAEGFTATGMIDAGGGSPLHNELKKLIKGVLPNIDHQGLYFARVDAQRSATRVDLRPEDPRLPRSMPNVPLLAGAGSRDLFNRDARVLVGWSGGDPEHPYAIGFDGSETVVRHTQRAAKVELGGDNATNGVAKGIETEIFLRALIALLQTMVIDPSTYLPNTATQTALTDLLATVSTVSSRKVFVDQ